MPAFNAGRTIDAALASVAGQILAAQEVIVVDDASTDDTAARAERWSDHLPIVVLRNEHNVGVGLSRTRAIAAATSELIAPLDADDVWLPDHLSTVVPLATGPRVIVAVDRRRWRPGAGVTSHIEPEHRVPPPDDQVEGILRGNFLFVGSVADRQCILDSGGSAARSVDDWEMWIRLIVEGGCRAVPASHATVLYRTDPTSLSAADGCLPGEIDLCERLLQEPAYRAYEPTIEVTLRRRHARRIFLDGLSESANGNSRVARRAYLQALVMDRSMKGGRQAAPFGSVTLRAAYALMAPRRALHTRGTRLAAKAISPPNQTTRETAPQ